MAADKTSKALLKAQQKEAQKDWHANITVLREVRDDPKADRKERMAAVKELREMGFDRSPSREPDRDENAVKILLGLPTIDMLRRFVNGKANS